MCITHNNDQYWLVFMVDTVLDTIDTENDFILNYRILVKLRKELKNKINLKTDSNHKESATEDIKNTKNKYKDLLEA